MKKICVLLCLLMPMLLLTACGGNGNDDPDKTTNAEKKEGIELSVGSRMTLGVGETKQIQAIDVKNESQMTNVVWTSEDPTIATVDFNGMVTGVADGETTITAASIDGSYKASCKVSVSSVLIGMSFENPSVTIEKGGKTTLKLVLTPANLTDVEISWMTGDPKVATVDEGVVTAVGNGSTSIIATSSEGINAVCTINVVTTVTGISLDVSKLELRKGESHQFSVSVLPEGASDPGLTWTSTNESVATVDADGVVVARSGGTTIITAKSENNIIDTCSVTVTSPVTGVTLDREEIVLNVRQADKLEVTILPADANNRQVIWGSSDLSVVTVSGDGTVMGLKAGTAQITATTVDGYFVASCNVTVKNLVTQITFGAPVTNPDGTPATNPDGTPVLLGSDLELGTSMQLVPTLIPEDCEPPVLTWTSSNPAVARVGIDGTVMGLSLGEATITVMADNGVYAQYVIRVIELEVPIETIIVDPTLTLKIGKTVKLAVSLLPANTTEGYTISSSNSSVVRVNADGTLVPLKTGSAIITIKSKSGAVSAICGVYVEELTDYEREEYRKEYDNRKKLLLAEHENNLNNIAAKWDRQIETTQNNLAKHTITTQAAYDSTRSTYVANLNDAKAGLDAATAAGNQELINSYTTLRDTWQKEITALDDQWTLYKLTTTQLENLKTSKANEIASENTRYQNALNALADEYSFLNE